MNKIILIVLLALSIQACVNNDPDKYEMRSPCVSADVDGGQVAQPAPCQKRPINKTIG